jgi:hypothetical protein
MIHITAKWWTGTVLALARAFVRARAPGLAARLATFVVRRGFIARLVLPQAALPQVAPRSGPPAQPLPEAVIKNSYPATAFQPGFNLVH